MIKLHKNQPLLSLILSLTPLIFGIVHYLIFKNHFSYLFGLLASFIILNIRLDITAQRTNSLNNEIASLLKAIKLNDSFDEISLILMLKSIGRYREGKLEIQKDDVFTFWYESTAKVKNTLDILTFVKPDDTWNLGWNKIALGIEQERIINRCKINRIFVLDTNENINNYKKIFQDQKQIGVSIFWVRKNELLKNSKIKSYSKELKTIDIAIVDNNWLRRVFLNKNRSIRNADFVKDNDLIQKATLLFQEAIKLAKKID